MATGDISTTLLRRTLRDRGFQPEGWKQGLNLGADPAKLSALETRVRHLRDSTGKRVVLIGWSLGGLYARVLAHRCSDAIDMLVTVGSPFSGDRRANVAWRLYEAINDHDVDHPPFEEDFSTKPDVTTIAVWSAVDGIVSPECARGYEGEADHCLRIDAPHFALGSSRACIEVILGKMAEVDRELTR